MPFEDIPAEQHDRHGIENDVEIPGVRQIFELQRFTARRLGPGEIRKLAGRHGHLRAERYQPFGQGASYPAVSGDQAFGAVNRHRQLFHCQLDRPLRRRNRVHDRQLFPQKIIRNNQTAAFGFFSHHVRDFSPPGIDPVPCR